MRAAPAALEPRVKLLAGAAVIGVASLLAYLPSLGGGFILDDNLLLTESPLVAAPDGLFKFWFTTNAADYWPMTNSSFWIEWRLWGMNPTGYHVTNLVLHIASAILIWLILRKLSIPGAWLAALLFAVHPVNVESVAWISQRKNTLSMLFFLLSILWYLKADRDTGRCYWLSLLAFTLAMLSKGSVAILPLVLLLIAWWQRGSITKRDLARVAPFFAVAVALTAVNIWFQTHGTDIEVRSAGFAERLAGAGAVVWFYLYKALVPLNLVFIYPQWDIRVSNPLWWLPLAAAVIVTALLLWKRDNRYGRALLFAWLFFCVALLPVMGFTDVGFMKHSLVADHYQHIAIIGIITLVAAGLALLYQRAQGVARSAAIAAAALVAVPLTFLSWQQSRLYANPITLYEATLVQSPRCWLAHNNLGNLLTDTGQVEKAIEHYRQALLLYPEYPDAQYNYGNALLKTGRLAEAIERYQQALRLKPSYAEAESNLGKALADAGRLPDAIAHLEHSLKLSPKNVITLNNLGDALFDAGRLPEAVTQYEQSLRVNPEYADAHYNLGRVSAKSGKASDAIEHYRRAVQLKPDYPEAHNNMGLELFATGRREEAVEHYEQALRLNPDFSEAHINLGNALASAGQWPQAIEHFEQSLRLNPEIPETHRNLGVVLAKTGRLSAAIEHFEQAVRLKPDYLECYAVLAEAYAKLNRSQEAIATAQKALDLARSGGQASMVKKIESWLNAYRDRIKGQDTLPQHVPNSP